MLERGRRNGAALAGMLIGMPVTQAPATVMEFDEGGGVKVRQSLNYLQRAKLKARSGANGSGRALRREGRAKPALVSKQSVGTTARVSKSAPLLPGPDWIEMDLAVNRGAKRVSIAE